MSEVIIIGLGQLGRVFAGGLLRAGCASSRSTAATTWLRWPKRTPHPNGC